MSPFAVRIDISTFLGMIVTIEALVGFQRCVRVLQSKATTNSHPFFALFKWYRCNTNAYQLTEVTDKFQMFRNIERQSHEYRFLQK